MAIDTILFDLDGTLLDRRATFRHHLQLQVERHPHCFPASGSKDYITAILALDERMEHRGAFYHEAERQLQLLPGAAGILRADFETHFPERCVAFAGVLEAVTALKDRGFRLGLITNGSALIQTRKIDGIGIRPLLDCILISETVGASKPDARIFARALDELGSAPATTVFVGDNPETDIAGAKRSGLIAVWKRDSFWPQPADADLVIDHVSELPQRLSEIVVTSADAAPRRVGC